MSLFMRLGVVPLLLCAAPALALAADPAVGVSTAPTGSVTGAPAAGELFAAADTSGGYSGLVLQKVLPHWQPPANVNGLARVLVHVSSQGRVLSCEPLRDPLTGTAPVPAAEVIPGTTATVTPLSAPPPAVPPADRALADLACRAVAAAGEFEIPPYGMIAEVSLILSAGNVRGQVAAQPADYAELVLKSVQPHIEIPPRLGGEFTVGVTLRVRGNGGIDSVAVSRPSGNKAVDAAIVQALTKPGVVPPPPGGVDRELVLTYTLRNQ